jgi:hypothetical protein
MRTLVVYYSLSGNTRQVATALAGEFGADVEEIRCTRYRKGPVGFIKAAYDSWADRMPDIAPLQRTLSAYDLVAIGGPMWAFRAATPVRACLRREAGRFAQVAFFLTMGGVQPDKAFAEMEALAQRAPVAKLAVSEPELKAGKLASAVQAFAASLKERQAV